MARALYPLEYNARFFDSLRPLPPQGRGLFFSNYRDTNGAVNVYGLCGFSTHWPGGHCQGTPSLTLTVHSSYPPYKPTSVRLRYVPRLPLGFLQTTLLPVTPLPASCLPAG